MLAVIVKNRSSDLNKIPYFCDVNFDSVSSMIFFLRVIKCNGQTVHYFLEVPVSFNLFSLMTFSPIVNV